MSVGDLGCVKTQKFEKRRELFFSEQAKANPRKNCRGTNCDSKKRSFYRLRAPLRFHTAKTHLRHPPLRSLCSSAIVLTPAPIGAIATSGYDFREGQPFAIAPR